MREGEKRLKLLQENNARIALPAGALFLLEPSPLHRRFLAYITNELAGPPQVELSLGWWPAAGMKRLSADLTRYSAAGWFPRSLLTTAGEPAT